MRFRDLPKLPLVLILVMVVAGALLYPQLGERIPMHWNAAGQIDRWEAKSLTSVFMLPLISVGLYVLFAVMPYFDPKRRNLLSSRAVYVLVLDLTVGLMALIHVSTLAVAMGYRLPVDRVIIIGVGLMFVVLGNYLGRVKQNWTMGVRLSWTLADEVVWTKTNRLGGRLFVVAGLVTMLSVFLSPPWNWLVVLGGSLAILPVTYVYAMVQYRRRHPEETGRGDSAANG